MTIYLGADQGGYVLKDQMKEWFDEQGWHYVDLGSFNLHKVSDAEIAREVAEKVLENKGSRGILFGEESMCQVANSLPGVQAVKGGIKKLLLDLSKDGKPNILWVPGEMDLAEVKKRVEIFLGTKQ